MTGRSSHDFIRNFLLVFGSQLAALASALVKALIIPVILGISDFGYWQIYTFYTVYVGIFTFGHNDGIYLKYGGSRFQDLPLDKLRGSNAIYVLLMLLGTSVVTAMAGFASDPAREFIIFAVAVNILVLGITSNISLVLQAVNRMKGYAFLNAADKIFFTIALFALLAPELRNFWFLIAVDLVGKIAVLIVLLLRYPQLYIGSVAGMPEAAAEFRENLRSGIQLMIANLSGMLVLGIGRITIEYFGELKDYAHYAFAITLANVVLMSVSALSIMMYPALRQRPTDSYLKYFNKTNRFYSVISLLMITGYFPAVAFIFWMAKKYEPAIEFLNVMFAVTVLQGKMQLVNNSYYTALRLERPMLTANLSSMLIATAFAAIAYVLTHSVLAIAYTTFVAMLIRVCASELFLRRHMGGQPTRGLLHDGVVLAVFLVLTTVMPPMAGMAAWLLSIVLIAVMKREELAAGSRQIRNWLG